MLLCGYHLKALSIFFRYSKMRNVIFFGILWETSIEDKRQAWFACSSLCCWGSFMSRVFFSCFNSRSIVWDTSIRQRWRRQRQKPEVRSLAARKEPQMEGSTAQGDGSQSPGGICLTRQCWGSQMLTSSHDFLAVGKINCPGFPKTDSSCLSHLF